MNGSFLAKKGFSCHLFIRDPIMVYGHPLLGCYRHWMVISSKKALLSESLWQSTGNRMAYGFPNRFFCSAKKAGSWK